GPTAAQAGRIGVRPDLAGLRLDQHLQQREGLEAGRMATAWRSLATNGDRLRNRRIWSRRSRLDDRRRWRGRGPLLDRAGDDRWPRLGDRGRLAIPDRCRGRAATIGWEDGYG